MFELFKKKKNFPDLSVIGNDMHSHLLPGIDDGSPDTETSIELIRGMMALGYKKFVTTPHIYWDLYQNTPETIQAAHTELRAAVTEAGLEVDIHYAAEYFLDEHFDELLEQDAPLLTIKDNLILVEISFINAPFDLKEILFKLQMKGYQPILAHPERYAYMKMNKEFYQTLKDTGCLFQLNLLSLTNYYGKITNELANYLIKKDFIDFLGTDLHHHRHLDALHLGTSAMDTVHRLLDSGKIKNNTL